MGYRGFFTLFNRIIRNAYAYCTLSCAVLAITAPILSYAGIPFSLLTPLGTLIFTPLVTSIIMLSSGMLCAILLGIPPTLFTIPLEWCALCWHLLLKLAPAGLLIPFPAITPLQVIVLTLSATMSAYWARQYSRTMRLSVSLTCISATYFVGWIQVAPTIRIPLTKSSSIEFVRTNTCTALIDSGKPLRQNLARWATYTVGKTLTLHGTATASLLLVKRVTPSAVRRAEILLKGHKIGALILHDLPTNTTRKALMALCAEHGVTYIDDQTDR